MPKAVRKHVESMSVEPIIRLWGWILLVWSLYRYFLTMPEWVDELISKPFVFVLPVLSYVYKKEKQTIASLGLTTKNLYNSIYIGVGFGMVFALEGVLANSVKYGQLSVNPIRSLVEYGLFPLLGISLVTAFSEEVLNRGFIFNRLFMKTERFGYAASVSTLLFVLLHVPILVTSVKLHGLLLLLYFVTNAFLGFMNCYIFSKTKSLVAPILIHVFWNMTVSMYL